MHSILIGMNSKQRDQVHIAIVVQPNKYFTANQDIEKVSSYVDKIITSPYKSKITKQHSSQKWIENERFTYIKALEYCATTSATWTLIVEDDAIASLRFLSQLSMSLKSLTKYKTFSHLPSYQMNNIGSLKLFQTEHYWGWSMDDLPILIFYGVVVFVLVLVLYYMYATHCSNNQKKILKSHRNHSRSMSCRNFIQQRLQVVMHPVLIVQGVGAAVFVISMLLALGKQSVFPPYNEKGVHGIVDTNTIDSNTIATVYPTRHVSKLVEYLQETMVTGQKCLPIDVAVSNWCVMKGYDRYYRTPSLFQHVGLWSSSERKRLNLRNVLKWNQIPSFKQSDTFVP